MWNLRIVSLLVLLIQPGFQIDDFYDDEFHSPDAVVRKFWGIQDVTISVGKLLHCKIPPDAFKGHIVSYDVKGEEEKPLPKWIIFDEEASVLEGVPSEDDIGDIRVNVKAFDSQGHFVSDMFVVEVYPLLEKNTNGKRKCKKGEDVNMIAIIIDKNISDFTPIQKIKAIQNLSAYLDIPINTLLLLSTKFIDDIEANAMLSIHKDLDQTNCNRSVLTWQIGCNEKIWAKKLRDVKLVKQYVKDGVLAKVLRLPLVESRLISSPNPFRLRRHISPNETGKSDSKASLDEEIDNEDETDDDDEGEGAEDLDPDFDISPPIPPEVSSASFGGNLLPTPVAAKPVIESDSFNKSPRKNVPPLVENNAHLSEDEESTEIPEESDILSSNRSFLDRNRTPELPLLLNSSTISFSPLPAPNMSEITLYPPTIMQNLPPITAVAGKRYDFSIPDDTFHDDQDGNTRNLTLTLKTLDESPSCPPWIEFDAEKAEILLLPRVDSVSNYNFVLEATNSHELTASHNFTVAVQYPPTAQKVNFEISLQMKPAEDQNLTVTYQLELLERIAKLYGDVNIDNIVVRKVSCNPFVLTWTNSSLSLNDCDNKTILDLLNVLTAAEWSFNVNEKVRGELSSLVDVEKVTWKGIGVCENELIIPRVPIPPKQNFKPVVHVRVDNITARVGELKVFKIPKGAFYDPDVPSTDDLKINVLRIDHSPIPVDNWLQYDATNRELYGLPMPGDVGSSKYQMECLDNVNVGETGAARQVIEVIVEPALKISYNIELSLTLKMSIEEFSKSLVRRLFIEKLAHLFGDEDASSIVIGSFYAGSVIVTWYNKSLPIDVCPETDMEQLRKVLLDDEGKLNVNVNTVLGPDFEVKSAQVTPTGICEGGLTEFHSTEMNAPSQEIYAIFSSATLTSYIREYFFEIVLPVLIIITMLLLAGIVACVLYRRQRRAKWTLGDDDRRTYRNKGIPVIFQDELEERLEPTNKSPIIMKEEKPPLPPPEYQKTLPMATTALLSDFDDPSYQQGSVTFTSQADRNGRSKATPIYRKPPPYVPP